MDEQFRKLADEFVNTASSDVIEFALRMVWKGYPPRLVIQAVWPVVASAREIGKLVDEL